MSAGSELLPLQDTGSHLEGAGHVGNAHLAQHNLHGTQHFPADRGQLLHAEAKTVEQLNLLRSLT